MLRELKATFLMWIAGFLGHLDGLDEECLRDVRYRLKYGMPRPESTEYILLSAAIDKVLSDKIYAAEMARKSGLSVDALLAKTKKRRAQLDAAPVA